MKKLPWSWFDHRTDLPQWLLAGIGQIVVEWSVLERELEELIRLSMDVDIRIGRVTAKGMNARTRIAVATNLLQARIYYDDLDHQILIDFTKLRNRITETTQSKRDMVAHGLWERRNKQWRVLRLSASRPIPQLQPEIKNLARAILPQAEPITRDKLRAISREIVADAKAVEALCERVHAALAPLQSTRPQYTRRRRNTP
jgi:hypothetical protein